VLLTNVIVIFLNGVFFLKWMVTKKMCNTNKNMTKIGVIIKGVYYIRTKEHSFSLANWDKISPSFGEGQS